MEGSRRGAEGAPSEELNGTPAEYSAPSITLPDFITDMIKEHKGEEIPTDKLWEAAERLDDLAALSDEEIIRQGLTYADTLIQLEHSDIRGEKLEYKMKLTEKIELNLPLLSAAMSKVTEAEMAIALAREGGAGVIHKNLSPEAQALEIENVKRASSALIEEPRTLSVENTVADFQRIKSSGVGSVMVTDSGEPDGKLIGMVTKRQLRPLLIEQIKKRNDATDTLNVPPDTKLEDIMHVFGSYELLPLGATQRDAMDRFAKMENENIDRLPVVDSEGRLRGLYTFKDIHEIAKYPRAAKDSKGRLIVGVGVGVGKNTSEHVDMLVEQEVDFVVVDAAHGHDQAVIDLVSEIKERHPGLQVIAGNVATAKATRALIEAGADAIKVGVGPGSICTTREAVGVGEAQVAALKLASIAAGREVPIIADGGIEQFGDINKALVAGADTVMMGSKFAGHKESPGEVVSVNGQQMMKLTGMGSIESIKEAQEAQAEGRYFQVEGDEFQIVAEGGGGLVPYKGEVHRTIVQMVGTLTKGLYYTGRKTLKEMHTCRFVPISPGAQAESHMHGIQVSDVPPNYVHSQ